MHVLALLLLCLCFSGLKALYPYGVDHGDKHTTTPTDIKLLNVEWVELNSPILGNWNVYIQDQGIVSFTSGIGKDTLALPSVSNIILAPYSSYFYNSDPNGAIFYRETKDTAILQKINQDIRLLQESPTIDKNFNVTNAFIVTFNKIVNDEYTFKKNIFQVVIGYDIAHTYAVFNYERLDDAGAICGFSVHKCTYNNLSPVVGSYLLTETSNVGVKGRHVYNMKTRDCTKTLRYSIPAADRTVLPSGTAVEELITLSKPMPVFHGNHTKLVLSVKGRISLEKYGDKLVTDLEAMDKDFILFGSSNYNTTRSGQVYYKEITTDQALLTKASQDIAKFINKEFRASHLILINFDQVYLPQTANLQNFQAVLASDGQATYLILHYTTYFFGTPPKAGYSSKDCEWNWFASKIEWIQNSVTNTGYAGQLIFKVSSERCFNQVMEKHGTIHGDQKLESGDEKLLDYQISRPMTVFETKTTDIRVSINGVISFKDDVTSFISVPDMLYNTMVAPLFNDLTTDNGGAIYNRETFLPSTLTRLSNIVNREANSSFECKHAFIVTYVNVQQYNVEGSRNTFQVAFASDGNNITYAVFTFYHLDSIQSAFSGVSDGKCNVNFPLPDLVAMKEIVYQLTYEECSRYKEMKKVTISPVTIQPVTTSAPEAKNDFNVGVIAGSAVAGVVLLAIIVAIVVVCLRKKKVEV